MSRVSCFAVCAALTFSSISFAAPRNPEKLEVTGYVFTRGTALTPGQVDAQYLTRINYAFANIRDGRMVLGEPADVQNFAQLTALRKSNPRLTVLISVGGWLWSTNFSDMALTARSQRDGVFGAV